MNILIVGNVLKDVYLNLDNRTEKFELDKHHTKWLNLSFNASEHHFFNRHSTYGGAAVTAEVFHKLDLPATISDSNFIFTDDGPAEATTKSHRYILIADDNVSYFVSSQPEPTHFVTPNEPIDYLYIDRSAHIDQPTAEQIATFLIDHPATRLIIYLKDRQNPYLSELAHQAALIFTEDPSVEHEQTILISDHFVKYRHIKEPIDTDRIDRLTHLSFYSIIAATVIGTFILGRTVEDGLKMARLNVENANLDSTLSYTELQNLLKTGNENLELIAANLVAPRKGILAADESGGSIQKKFANLNIEDSFENRHEYRNIFFTTDNLENYVNGVILFDETARDHADDGQTIVEYLTSKRIIPGIKVDQGLVKFDHSEETYTKGLDDLPKRLREYYQMGLRFAKWRAAFTMPPSELAITENCHILAEYARACQSAGLVPIVEPELVYDGNYSIAENAATTAKILDCLFDELNNFGINLRACILKVNMIIAGKQYETPSTPEEVGKATAEILKNHVPAELAGIVFLSGGQTPKQATDNLAAVIKNGPFPWPITFSFARALQDPALYAWNGNNDNAEKARQAFLDRLIANSEVL